MKTPIPINKCLVKGPKKGLLSFDHDWKEQKNTLKEYKKICIKCGLFITVKKKYK